MIVALLAALASAPDAPPPVRVATYQYPRYDRTAALAPLADAIAERLGRGATVDLFDSPDALSAALCNGDVNVAMTNLGAFVTAQSCNGILPIAVLDTPPSVLDGYRGVLLARRGAGVDTLAELGSRAPTLRFSEVLPGSTSGGMVQGPALRSVGVARGDFGALHFSGTHDGALSDLFEGRADIAALAEGPWRALQSSDPDRAAMLTLLWTSQPLPPGPVVCRLERTECEAISEMLLAPAASDVAASLAAGWSETSGATGFLAFDAARYAPFTER